MHFLCSLFLYFLMLPTTFQHKIMKLQAATVRSRFSIVRSPWVSDTGLTTRNNFFLFYVFLISSSCLSAMKVVYINISILYKFWSRELLNYIGRKTKYIYNSKWNITLANLINKQTYLLENIYILWCNVYRIGWKSNNLIHM